MIIIIINVYQWVFVLATGQPIKFRPIIQQKFCHETPARNRTEKLERAQNIFWEYWLKNFLSYFLGISNCLHMMMTMIMMTKTTAKFRKNLRKS